VGLDWDGPALFQSEARSLYDACLARSALLLGHFYPCHCSRRMLADLSAPIGGWSALIQVSAARSFLADWGYQGMAASSSWRLRLAGAALHWPETGLDLSWADGPTAVGDVVLRRADGLWLITWPRQSMKRCLGISTVAA